MAREIQAIEVREQQEEQAVPVQEEQTVPVQEKAPKAKPEAKKGKSDKTIIKELRAELKQVKEELETAQKDVDVQAHKGEYYYKEATKAKHELAEMKEHYALAKETMFNGVQAALRAFQLNTK